MLRRLTFTNTQAEPQKDTKKGFTTITVVKIYEMLKTENILPALYDGQPEWGEWQLQNSRS